MESPPIEKDSGSDTSRQHDTTSEKDTPYDRNIHRKTIPDDSTIFPEGGVEAWMVVLGSWAAMTASMVRNGSIQTVQAKSHQMASSTTVYTLIGL